MDQDGSRVPMKMGDFSVIDSEFNNIRERYASIITSSDARHQSNHNPIAIKWNNIFFVSGNRQVVKKLSSPGGRFLISFFSRGMLFYSLRWKKNPSVVFLFCAFRGSFFLSDCLSSFSTAEWEKRFPLISFPFLLGTELFFHLGWIRTHHNATRVITLQND